MNPIQFSLQTLLLCFVVVAAAVGLCGPGGLLLAAIVLGVAGYVRTAKHRGKAWLKACLALLFLLCSGSLLTVPPSGPARQAARKSCCMNNERQIALAFMAYEQDHGHLPPAYIADANGKPMHSWRVLILPYLDRKDIYDAYDFNEPWNGPHNRRFASVAMSEFTCPSQRNAKSQFCTNYVAVVGPGTAWPGDKTTTTAEISRADGCLNTLSLVELPNSDINWMEPRDFSFDELCAKITSEKRKKLFDAHDHRSVVSFVDGNQRSYSDRFLEKNIAGMATTNGGEEIDLESDPGPDAEPEPFIAPHWRIMISLVILFGTALLIIYRPLPKADERKEEPEEEIRFEDTSAPERKLTDGSRDSEANRDPSQPSPPAPLP